MHKYSYLELFFKFSDRRISGRACGQDNPRLKYPDELAENRSMYAQHKTGEPSFYYYSTKMRTEFKSSKRPFDYKSHNAALSLQYYFRAAPAFVIAFRHLYVVVRDVVYYCLWHTSNANLLVWRLHSGTNKTQQMHQLQVNSESAASLLVLEYGAWNQMIVYLFW